MTNMPTAFWSRLASELEALKEQQQEIVGDLERGRYDDQMEAADLKDAILTGKERAEWLTASESYALEMLRRY